MKMASLNDIPMDMLSMDLISLSQLSMPEDDMIGLASNESCIKMLSAIGDNTPYPEKVVISAPIIKINKRRKEQTRVLLITDKAIYNLKPKKYGKCKRRIELSKIGWITSSTKSEEFAIHIPSEYDYHYKSQYKYRIIHVVAAAYVAMIGRRLSIRQIKTESVLGTIITKDEAKAIAQQQQHHAESSGSHPSSDRDPSSFFNHSSSKESHSVSKDDDKKEDTIDDDDNDEEEKTGKKMYPNDDTFMLMQEDLDKIEWTAHKDQGSGKLYYIHTRTKQNSFVKPDTFTDPHKSWIARRDDSGFYYEHVATQETQWKTPTCFQEKHGHYLSDSSCPSTSKNKFLSISDSSWIKSSSDSKNQSKSLSVNNSLLNNVDSASF